MIHKIDQVWSPAYVLKRVLEQQLSTIVGERGLSIEFVDDDEEAVPDDAE